MKKNILIVVAHPDDEVLGVGGAIANHTESGDIVSVLIMADGEASRGDIKKDTIEGRQSSARKSASILGVQNIFFEAFPDNQMDEVALLYIVRAIEAHVKVVKPDVIYTHHGGDLNIDHRIVFEAVMTASRPIKGSFYPKQIYCFETVSSTEWGIHKDFIPNTYIDVENVFYKKLNALKCYESEMRDFPHPRSYEAVETLAKMRGSVVAIKLAEAFMCIRDIKG